MTARLALILLLGVNAAVLLYEASDLSLTYHGAELIYADTPILLAKIIRFSIEILGANDVALRLPMILMNSLSALLLYLIARPYARHDRERVWLVAIFVMLPGIISSSLLVDSAALVTLGLFLYLFARQRFGYYADLLLPLFAICDASFMFLFAGLAIQAVDEKRYRFLPLYLGLFILCLWYYGFNTGGLPENQFLDTLGLYAAVLSPVIFIYMFYTLYRRVITSQKDTLWYVSSTALVFSLLLSFRQRIEIEHFAPYLIAGLPLGMQTFYHSYRVRLRPFRKRYRVLFILMILTLVLNAGAVFFNKAAYLFLEEPSHYFAYRAHIAKELAEALHDRGVTCATFEGDARMQMRMRFYGIKKCAETVVVPGGIQDAKNVTIRYYNKEVATFGVTKVPKN